MNTKSGDRKSRIRTWYSNLSWIKKTIAGVLAVATAIGALAGVFEPAKSVYEWLTHKETELLHSPWLGLEVWQNGTQNDMFVVDGDSESSLYDRKIRVPMRREPLELRLPEQGKDVAVQICAWSDDSIFVLKSGASTSSVPWFRPGTGMAATEFGSAELILTKEAHNYYGGNRKTTSNGQDKIFVSSVAPRNELLRKNAPQNNKSPLLDKEDPSVEESTPLPELRNDIFLTVFVDKDKDDVVDNEEYQYIVLEF